MSKEVVTHHARDKARAAPRLGNVDRGRGGARPGGRAGAKAGPQSKPPCGAGRGGRARLRARRRGACADRRHRRGGRRSAVVGVQLLREQGRDRLCRADRADGRVLRRVRGNGASDEYGARAAAPFPLADRRLRAAQPGLGADPLSGGLAERADRKKSRADDPRRLWTNHPGSSRGRRARRRVARGSPAVSDRDDIHRQHQPAHHHLAALPAASGPHEGHGLAGRAPVVFAGSGADARHGKPPSA